MAKKDRKLMQELLSKALEPPRKPMSKERLDSLLEDYDDGQPLSKMITLDQSPDHPDLKLDQADLDQRSTDLKLDQADLDQRSDQKDQLLRLATVASLAKSATQATPLASLANQTILATVTSLANQATLNNPNKINLLASLKNIAGYLQLSNTLIDSLFPQLSPDEVVTYLHLYRLSWGFNNPTCIISLPALSKRTGISPRQIQRVILSLENKSLIKKEGSIFGKGQVQGNVFRVDRVASLANQASQDTVASLATVSTIKDDDDLLKKENHHQRETMMIYEKLTKNVWSKTDQQTYTKIQNIPLDIIEQTILTVLERSSTRPNSLNYFVKEIKNQTNPTSQSKALKKKAMEKIVAEVRNKNVGSNISFADFVDDVKRACVRDDIIFDNDVLNEILDRKK